jgi:hypothetical protein
MTQIVPGDATNSPELSVHAAAEAIEQLFTREEDGQPEGAGQQEPSTDDELLAIVEAEAAGDTPPEEAEDGAGDEPPAEDDEDDEPTPALTTRKVVVDGEELEVTEEELVKGYSRTADYTRKTQKLAEERRAFETELVAVTEERKRYADVVTKLEQRLEQESPEPDWAELRATLEPGEFAAQWAEWGQHKEKLEKVKAEAARARELAMQSEAERMTQHLLSERQKLVEKVPEWKDPQKLEAAYQELLGFAKEAGYTDDELAQVTDHRAVMLMRKAMLYDRAVAKAKATKGVKPAAPAPTPSAVQPAKPGPAKPAVPPTQKRAVRESMSRLKNSGSTEDAARAILALDIF